MKRRFLAIALPVIFVGCSSAPIAPTKLRQCPGFQPLAEPLDQLVPTFREPPRYPREAINQGLSGSVQMAVWVSYSGFVEQVCVLESSPPGVFDSAALQ